MKPKEPSLGLYVVVYLALMALLATSYGVWALHIGIAGEVTSLVIAVVKATLVALFFMHLFFEPKLPRMAAVIALFMLWVATVLTLADYLTRA